MLTKFIYFLLALLFWYFYISIWSRTANISDQWQPIGGLCYMRLLLRPIRVVI